MEEYPYPIAVEGEWSPEQAKSLKNKLQIYFQSKKKSQGGDCVVRFNENTSAVTVLFKSSDTRDNVLSKADHVIIIDKDKVELKVSKPGDVLKETDNSVKLTEQASGYQELNQNARPIGSEEDVKNVQESFAVVLENISDEAGKDVLALLVENVSCVPEKDFSMELIPELKTAVVTFNSPSASLRKITFLTAVGKFLEESKRHKKFQDYGWKARALERSTCVRVENLSAEANNKMLLELYFEKWGGPVEESIIVPLEQAAIITFTNEEDKDKVLKMEHKISNVPVKIYPYCKSLDTALYGSNRPTLKLPEPITISVHPAIRNFLLKKGLISSISDKMSKQFCQMDMDKPEVLLSPDPALLKQKGVTRRHIDCWAKNASDAFKTIISNYTAFELPVLNPVWTKAESDIKELGKDQVFIYMDASKGALTMAGATHDINGLKSVVGKMLDRASTQMERERSSITEVMELTPAMYSLLQQDGLQNALTASPQLHLDYDKKINKLHLSGLQTEILTLKNWVLQKKLSMKENHLKVDRSLLEYLRSVDCDEMSKDLFIAQGISAVYTVDNEDLLLIGSTGQALSEAEKKLNTVLQSKDIIVEDRAVLALPQWQDLHKQLQSLYNTSKKRIVLINLSLQRDKVIVSGFREPVAEVSRNLGDFIEKHTKVEDSVRVKSHAVVEFMKERKSHDWQHFMKSDEVTVGFDSIRPRIKLSGERRFVQPAMSFFKTMADALYTDTLIIKKAGAKKYFKEEGRYMLSFLLKEKGFVIVLQEDHMLDEEEEDDEGKGRGSFEEFGQCCEVQMPGGVTVKVREADICKMKVDAVVNAANEDLLHTGGVALALLQAAGPDLQDCCSKHVKRNGPLRVGEAIITEAGRLPCKYVVHAVGPRYNSADKPGVVKRLQSAVRESLKQASGKQCSSIAFPVISSGIFGCPLELCTETIASEVRKFILAQDPSDLRSKFTEIHLVDNNRKTVDAMAQAVRKEFSAFSPKMNVPHHKKPLGYGSGGHRDQDYHGHGNPGNINTRFGDHSYDHKNVERQAQRREETNNSVGSSARYDGLTVLETKTTKDRLQIFLSKGNIQDAKADVIVNTISDDLDLNKGAISKALLETAGHRLQEEVTAARGNRLNYGEMVITDGYKLNCAKVFHVVCPFWSSGRDSEDKDKVLRQIIRDCLKKAEALRMVSVSFPAIGTGNLGFPKDLVAKIMLSEVQEFTHRNLKEITVIVHPSDRESLEQTEIMTSAGQLPCGHIIHIVGRNQPSEIKDVVLSVLKMCEANQLSSVAFPALGTGHGRANPADVADAMVDAVVDFVKKKKLSSVKLVKFLIFQANMVTDFHQCMLRRSGEKVEEEKGIIDRIKGWTKELMFWDTSESPKNEEFVMVVEEIEPAVFQLCGDTPQDLNKARDMINSLILKEYVNIPIRDSAISHFTKEDAEMLSTMQRELSVSIKLESKDQDPVIKLEGLTRDVHTAESRIRDMIRRVERHESKRREAFIISSVVEWKYLEHTQNLKNFDMMTNYDLEKAFQNKQTSIRIKIDNDEYNVDFVRLQAKRGSRWIELQRLDLTDAQYSLPSHWNDMKGQTVDLVKLTEGSKEYGDVEKEFMKTGLTFKIIQIDRVQNSTLWKNYMIKKEELEVKNKHKNNEMLLFHGTGPDKTDHINHHGFNRSYAGIHGAMYGNGTYFAVDASYSAQGYSKPDAAGHKRMYLARVLVGDFTQGKQGILVPPAKSSNSADLYNSVTNNTNSPTMFVIFNDVQAYPEYLITFQSVSMEEYSYPIVVEGDWSPEQEKRLKNKLQIYFQSKKKSQGGECVIQFNEKSSTVIVLFKSSDIRDNVLSKEDHVLTIDNVTVKLKVSKPEDVEKEPDNSKQLTMEASYQQPSQNVPTGSKLDVKNLQESCPVALENLSDELSKNVLALLVENVSGVPEKDFSMELIPELNTAILTFKNPSAVGKFLEESKPHKKFKDYGLKARALERSTCVQVENLSAEANNKMLLEMYFENWGAPVEETIICPLDQAAIITFTNVEDKEDVLKIKHSIFNIPVKIYPYYKSLGTALYGSSRPTLKLPEAFTVSVHPAIRKFLLMKSLISSISDKMGLQFCQIDMDKPEVLLSPDPVLLKQKVETRRHIDCWAKNASDTFKTIISDYTAFELPVLYPVWTKAESDIKGLLTDQVYVYMNASKGALIMAGATHDINGVKSVVGKMLDRASTQMERERSRITDDVKVTPAVHSQNTVPSGSEAELNLQGTYAVVLENVSVETNKDVLALLVENVSSVPEKDFSMELIPELNTAVVIFHSPSGKFLEESKTHKKFQDYGWKARALERSTCVRVENLSAEANNKMLLELYFDKWGGPVEETIIVPLEHAAIITFTNEEDKQKVLKMKHKISNVPVKIYPYCKSLDTALYGSNRPTLKLPEPITISVHPAIRNFLLKKRLISSISDKMSKQFCQIDMDKPEVLLSPDPALLKQKGVTRRHIDCWAKNASDTLKTIISNYTSFELPVLYPVWTKAESDIKGLVTDQVFIYMDASKGALTMAGVTHDINRLKSVVGKMLDRASTQMERERSSVTEVMKVTPAMYSLLQQDGLQNTLTASPQLHLDYDKKLNKLHLSGLQREIITLKNWVLEKKLSMIAKPLKVDRSLLEFLRSLDCDEMSKDLFIAQGISAVYTVENEDLVLIGSTGQALSEAEKKLNTVLQSKDIIVQDKAVLALPQWQDLHKQLQSLYNTSKKRIVLINLSLQRDKVIVSGFREPVAEVSRHLGDFIEKHTKVEHSVCVKSHAVVEFIKDRKPHDWQHFMKSAEVTVCFDSIRPRIKLSGELRFVQPAMSFFKKMADALFTDTLIIKKAGAKKYFKEEGRYMMSFMLKEKRFVIVLQEDHMLDEVEQDDKGKDRGSSDKFGQCCEVQMPRRVSVRAIRKEFAAFNPKMNVPHHKKPLGHGSYGHREQGYHGQGNQGNRSQKFGDHSYDHRNVEKQVHRREETDFSGVSSARYDGLTVLETTEERLQIFLSKGNIEDAKQADVIVNTISDDLDLNKGTLSKALLKTAGHRHQEEFTAARILRHGISSPVTKRSQSHQHFTTKLTPSSKPAQTFGHGRANQADVADAMVDAVVDFVKKKKLTSVKLVKFLIFQANMVTDFHQSMLRRTGEKVEEEKGIIDRIKDWTKELMYWDSSESPKNEEFVMVVEEIEPAVFQLCGDTPQDLNKARDMINSLILKEYVNIPIRDSAISHFTKEDVEMLSTMQRELSVSIKLESKDQDPVIKLEGLTRDVHMAESRIRDMIRRVERHESKRREAFIISSVVEWKYLEHGKNLKNFDMITNYDLEKAFQNKQTSIRIKIDNDEYNVDFVRLQAKRGSRWIELQRLDLPDAQYSLPSHWNDMKGQTVDLVKLTEGSKEYGDVEKEFMKTGLTFKIIQIDRVQNSTLWKNYMIKKEELEVKNKHKNNEMLLFHGTGPDKTDHINHHGFNRSYAGIHGAMYGNGTYFAVDASYSAKGYSKPDAIGHKRMYLARVLVGDFTQGKQGILVPPTKRSNSADLYNSVTDNTNRPTMFVIFNDVQAYPEYLITFQ
ncbi:Poly [ADP-ribose] polymerase 14 [Triplophysa tibetana]|uniref:Poly [ADP-ribose] polymerase n=1 Tax=Triplophysa tibetana TaxID=1572043 RepID=A0A5A9N425_9TELE|nr:Poly [ADP-ribose] polymerase 14 [Triplophysa tibetana]